MKNITLRKIKYFNALVKYKNFGLAANAVAISQPAMSMQIKDLESEIGAPLIEKGTNQIILTNLGKEFHKKCTIILENVEELTAISNAANGQPLENLKIGIIPTVAPYLLPSLIVEAERKYPDLSLVFKESQTTNLIFELREGNLDCCILALPISEAGFETKHLFDESFLLVRKGDNRTTWSLPQPTFINIDFCCWKKATVLEIKQFHFAVLVVTLAHNSMMPVLLRLLFKWSLQDLDQL